MLKVVEGYKTLDVYTQAEIVEHCKCDQGKTIHLYTVASHDKALRIE